MKLINQINTRAKTRNMKVREKKIRVQILPSKCHKDVLKLQCVGHFGPFNPDASRIAVLWLMVEPAGESDGAAAMCHHFTRSRLHDHCSGVILCERTGRSANENMCLRNNNYQALVLILLLCFLATFILYFLGFWLMNKPFILVIDKLPVLLSLQSYFQL